MPKFILLVLLASLLAMPCHAAENNLPLNDITRKWVDARLGEIDKFVAQCGQNADCSQEAEKKYTNICDLLTKKISDLCIERLGADDGRKCQEDLASFLEANTNARMEAGKLQRKLYSNIEEGLLLQRIFASDMALLGAYIDTLSVMLEK